MASLYAWGAVQGPRVGSLLLRRLATGWTPIPSPLPPHHTGAAFFPSVSEEVADGASQRASLPSASSLGGPCGLKIQSVLLLEISIQKGASSKLRIFG